MIKENYLLEYKCNGCGEKKFIPYAYAVFPSHISQRTHIRCEVHVGYYFCGQWEEAKIWVPTAIAAAESEDNGDRASRAH